MLTACHGRAVPRTARMFERGRESHTAAQAAGRHNAKASGSSTPSFRGATGEPGNQIRRRVKILRRQRVWIRAPLRGPGMTGHFVAGADLPVLLGIGKPGPTRAYCVRWATCRALSNMALRADVMSAGELAVKKKPGDAQLCSGVASVGLNPFTRLFSQAIPPP
jgi:hypothetical protein